MKNKDLKERIIDISYKHKLSHLGSCLTAVDIIDEIYQTKKPDEKFILSAGHAGLALYVVLEKYEGHDAEMLFEKHGVHPNRNIEHGIWASTGSLGQGLPIALGMALADRTKNVHCLITDGEAHEGSIYETLNYQHEHEINNLIVFCNWNGFTAYQHSFSYVSNFLRRRAVSVVATILEFPFLKGLDAHYHVMNEEDYKVAKDLLNETL